MIADHLADFVTRTRSMILARTSRNIWHALFAEIIVSSWLKA